GTAGAIAVTNQDAVQIAAFFGDVVGSAAPFSLADATAISAVAGLTPSTTLQTIPGFSAYSNLDPVIIGDVALQGLSGIFSTDASKMNQELTMAQAAIPYLPVGLTVNAAPAFVVTAQSINQPMSSADSDNSFASGTMASLSRRAKRRSMFINYESEA